MKLIILFCSHTRTHLYHRYNRYILWRFNYHIRHVTIWTYHNRKKKVTSICIYECACVLQQSYLPNCVNPQFCFLGRIFKVYIFVKIFTVRNYNANYTYTGVSSLNHIIHISCVESHNECITVQYNIIYLYIIIILY